VSRWVKELHDYHCQICGERIEIAAGAYAEGAHIRPLGRPHDGPDVAGNVLCLCPNDHVRFEFGTVIITNDLKVEERPSGLVLGELRTTAAHIIDTAQLTYHRERFDLS
jgi:predicted restriction endonuclease